MVTRAELFAAGVVIRQDYDGLQGDFEGTICDPDKVLYVVDSDGVEHLPLDENGNPVEIYPGRSKTVQADLDATDINKMIARFEKQGIVPLVRAGGEYLDVSQVPDFRGALEQVRKANEYFQTLPASSRMIFHNDPAEFMDAVKGDDRVDDLVKAGVLRDDEVEDVPPPVVP